MSGETYSFIRWICATKGLDLSCARLQTHTFMGIAKAEMENKDENMERNRIKTLSLSICMVELYVET